MSKDRARVWPPTKLPAGFPLTPYRDGYCKTIHGRWRHVCGKLTPQAARARYEARLRNGDFDARRSRVDLGGGLTVKGLSNLYGAWLRTRLAGQHRRKLTPRTFADYRLAIQLFLDVRVDELRLADARVAEMGPRDFGAFVGAIPGRSPYTRSRYVAAIRAMFAWAAAEGIVDRMPVYGADFAKASRDELREARASLQKSLSPEEIRKVLARVPAKSPWQAIILLALNGAFSNVELSRLRRDQIDLDAGVVQSIRGKKGRAVRRVLLWPATVAALRGYRRPKPARPDLDALFFLTRRGRPWAYTSLQHDAAGKPVSARRHDMLTGGFGRMLEDAGLARKGRSFSGLRTTFRTEAQAMPNRDDDAIDLICGHPRRHISSEYVEKFPAHQLQAVVDFVFDAIFGGWAIRQTDRPRSSSPPADDATAPPPAATAASA